MKFYISIGIMSWTISWLAYYLANQKKVLVYSWVVVITMIVEMITISFQSARGQQSHFNVDSLYLFVVFSAERIQYFQNIFVVNKAWVNTFYTIRTRRLGNGWQN
jgi:hypothetical protein